MFRATKTLLLAVAAASPTYSRAFSSTARGSFIATSTLTRAGFVAGTQTNTFLSISQPNDWKQKTSALAMSTSSGAADLLCVHVFVSCKPGTEEAFKAASLANARDSAKEEGIARFDVIQQIDDATKFVLVEVYKNAEAPALHKETAHYNTWRETVADMMAEPRQAIKYKNHFPATSAGWDYSEGTALE